MTTTVPLNRICIRGSQIVAYIQRTKSGVHIVGLFCPLLFTAALKMLFWRVLQENVGMWPGGELVKVASPPGLHKYLSLTQEALWNQANIYYFLPFYWGSSQSLLSRTVSTWKEIRIRNEPSHLLAHKRSILCTHKSAFTMQETVLWN